AHVNNRHNIRVTGHADAHNAALHSELIQLERAYVADLAALDQAHTQGANEAKSDYEEQLQQIAADQAAGLEDAKSLLKEEVAAVKEEYADPLSGVNSVIKRS